MPLPSITRPRDRTWKRSITRKRSTTLLRMLKRITLLPVLKHIMRKPPPRMDTKGDGSQSLMIEINARGSR